MVSKNMKFGGRVSNPVVALVIALYGSYKRSHHYLEFIDTYKVWPILV